MIRAKDMGRFYCIPSDNRDQTIQNILLKSQNSYQRKIILHIILGNQLQRIKKINNESLNC